jgi:dihydroflavonol-4-reductase
VTEFQTGRKQSAHLRTGQRHGDATGDPVAHKSEKIRSGQDVAHSVACMLFAFETDSVTKKPMRILVLGATGHAGQAIVRHALEQGREVTALTRRADPECLRGLGVKIACIEPDLRSLGELTAGHDLLVDAAAPYKLELCIPGSLQWRSQVDAAVGRTQLVIEAARRNDAALAFVSTYGTIPRQENPPSPDALWRRMVCPYYESKSAMDQAVLAAARDGLQAVIVNPVAFVGPWNFREGWNLVPNILSGQIPVVIDLVMSVIDVRDVADAIDLAISREYFGRQIPLAGHTIHASDLVVRTARLAGMPVPPPMSVPGPLAVAGAYWTHLTLSAFGLRSPELLSLIAITPEMRPLAPSPQQIELGVNIRPLETSLRDAVSFHLQRPCG